MLRKKELLYKKWYLDVYEPIQKEVYKNVNSSSAEYARNVRNLRYLEFLHHSNKRGAVYRDDFEPDEYDPTDVISLDANLSKKLNDPTCLAQRKSFNEQSLIYKCAYGREFTMKEVESSRLPVIENDNTTRKDLNWKKWILNEHNTMDSKARIKSA
jgi:hypothetical protein